MSVALLCCGALLFAGGAQEAKAAGKEAPVGVLQEPAAPVTLSMWMQEWPAAILTMNEFHAEVVKNHPNIKLDMQQIPWAALSTKMIPAVFTNEEPDVMFMYNHWLLGKDVQKMFLRLTPDIMPLKDVTAKYLYEGWLGPIRGTGDGELYAIPYQGGGECVGVLVNKDMADASGVNLKSVKTWNDIFTASKAMTQYNPDGSIKVSGISLMNLWALTNGFIDWVRQKGVEPFDPKTNKWNFNNPQSIEIIKTLDRFVREKIWDPKSGNALEAFPKGIVASHHVGIWKLAANRLDYPQLNMDYYVFPLMGDKHIFTVSSANQVCFSRRLDGDKKRAALLYGKEMMTGNFIKYAQKNANGIFIHKHFVDRYKAGEFNTYYTPELKYVIEKALEISQFVSPHTEKLDTVLNWNVLAGVFTPEFEKVFMQGGSYEDFVKNVTEKCTKAEQEARL
jgi:ABC-type glycerol-3-phosphate transport system substrate-binding protein